jgi:hypothetical protein
VPPQSGPAIARAWRRFEAVASVPSLRFVPTGDEPREPGFARPIFSLGYEPLLHGRILGAASLRRNGPSGNGPGFTGLSLASIAAARPLLSRVSG